MRDILIFLIAASLAAQQPPPIFRAGAKLVEVSVVANGKNGPAIGLTRADFTLLDDGKPREIAVFSVESRSGVRATPALPPGIVLNRMDRESLTPSGATVLLIDQKNTRRIRQAFAIEQIAKFVAKRREGDRIGIYTFTRKGVQAAPDLTTDGEALNRAAKNLKPMEPETSQDPCGDSGGIGLGRECVDAVIRARAAETKAMFLGIARHLANVPGRKSIVWVTAGFPLLSRTFDFTPDMKAAVRALNEANIAVYAVDARGLAETGRGVYPPGFEVMDLVSSGTGGEVFINSSDIAGAIGTAVNDGDLVYMLGFYPPESDGDGKEHKIKVRVARQGVSLRYRESYSIAKDTSSQHPTPEQLLADSLDATQIQIAARVVPDKAVPDKAVPDEARAPYRLRVSVNLHDVQFERQGTSFIGALSLAYKVEGTQAFRSVTRLLDIPEDQFAAAIEKGALLETPVLSQPKDVLRIVVQDQTTGAAGSLRLPIGAP